MSVTETPTNATGLPLGTWKIDRTHSSASFAVKHMVVATFRGRFETVDATLTVSEDSATLEGSVEAGSIVVKDPNLQGHLGSPDFFDVEQYPHLTFTSSDIRREGEELLVRGELTIKGHTHPLEARGTLVGPAVTLGDVNKIGLQLETTVDRTQYGLEWNAPLPSGGFALANEVQLTVELELIES